MISDLTIEMLDHPLSGTKIAVRCSTNCWLAENTVPVPEEWRRERP
jgi:hypothetical protein